MVKAGTNTRASSRPNGRPARADKNGGPGFLQGGGEAGEFIRGHDWAGTPLGPLNTWPQSLRTALRLMLNARYPVQLWWGPAQLFFYNDVYRVSVGIEADTGSIGRPGRNLRKSWKLLGPHIRSVMSSGESTQNENVLVSVARNSATEDVYWTHNLVPIDDPAAPSGVGGVMVAWVETTAAATRERQREAGRRGLRRLLEKAPGFITILLGPDHVYEFVNETHNRLFGSQNWLGKPVREAFPDVAGQGFFELLDRVYRTGEQVALRGAPIHFHRAPGEAEEQRFIDFVYAPIMDAAGVVVGVFCEGFDVTEAHIAKEMLRESEARLQAILDTVPDALVVTDEDGIVLSFSPAAETLFQWSKSEVVGQYFLMLVTPPERETLEADMERRAAAGEGRTIGLRRILMGQRKDGSAFPLDLFVGVANTNGHRFFTGFVRDLTEQQAAETRFQELQSELAHVSRLADMGEMASNLAHELNQPLSAISNYLRGGKRLLETENCDSRALPVIEKAADQALRAGEIIRRLRTFIAGGESDRCETSLKGLLEEASVLGLVGARERGIDTRFDWDSAVDAVVVDRVQVQQVVLNLLRNAIDAMKDAPRRELGLSTAAGADGMAMVSVTDTGSGVSPEIADRLFQPFVTTKGGEGMGVGLSICRGIIEAHGGRIWAEPNRVSGTIFRFTLPTVKHRAEPARGPSATSGIFPRE